MAKLAHVNEWFSLPFEEQQRCAKDAGYKVAGLAELLHVSPRTLEAAFKRHLNCSPKELLRGMQMTRAIEAFQEGKNVSEVADELGYKSPTRFSEAFFKWFEVICTGKSMTAPPLHFPRARSPLTGLTFLIHLAC